MATRNDLKTVPYSLYTPDDLRLALNESGSPVAIPIPNKLELEDTFGGIIISGKGTVEYGQGRNQNFINLLANFASLQGSTPGFPDPLLIPNPFVGQAWYDLTDTELKIFDGAAWVPATSSISSSSVVLDSPVAGETDLQLALEALEALIGANTSGLAAHLADTVDSHDASSISLTPAVRGFGNVQDSMELIDSDLTTTILALTAHINDTSDAHDASAISVSPVINGTFDVQAALESLDNQDNTQDGLISANTSALNAHLTDNTDAHDASAISITAIAQIPIAFDVQTALSETNDRIDTSGVQTFQSGAFPATSKIVRTVNLPAAFSPGGPDLVQLVLINTTAEWGYVPGDYMMLNEQGNQRDESSSADQESSGIWFDPVASPLVVRFLINYNKTSDVWINRNDFAVGFGANAVNATPAFWEVRLRAYKFS